MPTVAGYTLKGAAADHDMLKLGSNDSTNHLIMFSNVILQRANDKHEIISPSIKSLYISQAVACTMTTLHQINLPLNQLEC